MSQTVREVAWVNFASWGGILVRPNNSSVTIGQTKMPPHPRLTGFMATLIMWCHLLIDVLIRTTRARGHTVAKN